MNGNVVVSNVDAGVQPDCRSACTSAGTDDLAGTNASAVAHVAARPQTNSVADAAAGAHENVASRAANAHAASLPNACTFTAWANSAYASATGTGSVCHLQHISITGIYYRSELTSNHETQTSVILQRKNDRLPFQKFIDNLSDHLVRSIHLSPTDSA